MKFKLGELFCGPGGIAWGATNAKIRDKNYAIIHEWANDYDKDTCDTYRHNICPDKPKTVHHEDIRKLDMSKLKDINALAFGFPCNDYSVVGERNGMDGIYGPLYSYGVKAIKKFKPDWFLAENVGGLKNANDGKALFKILGEFQEAGYRIVPHLYKFEEYGIPQARHRMIIIGIRNDINGVEFKVPSPKKYQNIDNTCRNAIENPPIPKDAYNNELTKQSETVIKRLRHILPGQNAFTADLPEELQLHVTGAKLSQIYKRLDPTKPAYTVTGSGGGGTHIYHWSEPRALTNRERARLQTFPDDYEFLGSKESVRKQIGMAVPCEGAKIIFEAILNSFAGIDYESIEPNINIEKIMEETNNNFISDYELKEKILFNPIRKDANELLIVSGYANPNMASLHLKQIKDLKLPKINISLIVGMCAESGIRINDHEGFKQIQNLEESEGYSSFKCQYVHQGAPVNSNVYIWLKNKKPYCAFTGSLNYTQLGFSTMRRDYVTECDAKEAFAYFNTIEKDTINCTHNEIEEVIRLTKARPEQENNNLYGVPDESLKKVSLSLLTHNKDVGYGSGINWGHRRDGTKREQNQAYIPLPANTAKSGFFPLQKQHFIVITDDRKALILRVEQQNNKAITTPLNNSLLGEYFRNRMGLANGAFMTKADLEAYGRTNVTFYKIDDEQFYMDFSV